MLSRRCRSTDSRWQSLPSAVQHAESKDKGDAAYEAMEAVTEARAHSDEAKRISDHKCDECHASEEVFNEGTTNVFEKAEALERHVKTAPMRAESLAIKEDDFNKTLIEEHEEAPVLLRMLASHLNEPAALFFLHPTADESADGPKHPQNKFCTPASVPLDFQEKSTGHQLQMFPSRCSVQDRESTCDFGRPANRTKFCIRLSSRSFKACWAPATQTTSWPDGDDKSGVVFRACHSFA